MDAKRHQIVPKIIREHNFRTGAEIGTCSGVFAKAMLKGCPDLSLICVDYWPADYTTWRAEEWGAELQAHHRARFMKLLKNNNPRLRLIEKPSVEAAREVKDASLDFVFIDADHSYAGCRDDIRTWSPKVRPGGFVMGHDYESERFPGVVKAVDEAFSDFEVLDDRIWLVRT